MKYIFSPLLFALSSQVLFGQTFTPPEGSTLTNGNIGSVYAGQTIIVSVPTTTTVTGQQMLDGTDAPVLAIIEPNIDPNADYPFEVTSSLFAVTGLPSGLTSNCGVCEVDAGSSLEIFISGTPTQQGTFTVNIVSEVIGIADVDTSNGGFLIQYGGNFDPGIGFPVPLGPLVGGMDAENYTLEVSNISNLPSFSVATVASDNCNGSAEVILYSGSTPITYTFSTGQSGSQPTLDSLCPDIYSVTVEDANGGSVNSSFVITEATNVYSSVFGNGDTLFSSPIGNCDLDFNAPIDSFQVNQLIASGPDTLFGEWVVWQQGNPYTVLGAYPNVTGSNIILSMTLFCINGRSQLGSFQLFANAPAITSGIAEAQQESFPLNIYPNPTISIVTLQTTTRLREAWITDLRGRRTIPLQSVASQWQANLSALPAGVYMVEAIAENGARVVKKVVKK